MKRPAALWFGIVLLAVVAACWAGPAAAGGGISGSLGFVPIGSGDAGDGPGWGPKYDDVYETGGIIRIEPFYDLNPMIRLQAGLSGARWKGQTYDGVSFDDLKMTALYGGVRIRFLEGRPIRPYAVADLGFAHFNAVSVHNGGGTTSYWGKTDTGYFDIGGGCEFIVTPNLSFFADLRIMATGEPDSNNGPDSDADGVGSMPFTGGVNFTF